MKKRRIVSKPEGMQCGAVEAPKRTLERVNQEYTHLCAQLGDLQYKLQTIPLTIYELVQRIGKFNEEALSLQKAQ